LLDVAEVLTVSGIPFINGNKIDIGDFREVTQEMIALESVSAR
jgi:hypothetical protein